MNQFKIRAVEYTKEGALTTIYHDYTYGTADTAKGQYDALNREYWTDETTGEKTNIKKYKVTLWVLTYKQIENVDEFFAQF